MNFNISKNVPSAIFALSAPTRARNRAIATAILLLLVFAGFVQAAGDAEWAAQASQVNDALRQMRRQAQGVPEAMQYVNQAEKLWKQAQDQWAMQQRYQQQYGLNQIRTQLLAQQQNLMNQLIKQQQFLQQQLAASKTPELKTINPFGDYGQHGVSLHPKDGRLHGPGTIADTPELSGLFRQPDMNAKEGPGMEAWKEAMRQLDSISSASSSSATPSVVPSQTPNKNGSWDNPFANDPNVVDLTGVANPVAQSLKGAAPERSLKVNPLPMPGDDRRPDGTPSVGSEPMSEVMAKFLESAAVAEEAKSWGMKNIWEDAGRQVKDGAGKFDLLHYGNWYGSNWSGGPRGDRGPVDSLDALAMRHDFAYDAAKMQGKIYGPQEELRLQAIADAIAVTAASQLKPDPAKWDQPAKDPKKADIYRDRIIGGFDYLTGPARAAMSKIETVGSWIWSPIDNYYQAPNAINKYDPKRLNQAADVLLKQWLKEHPNASNANALP